MARLSGIADGSKRSGKYKGAIRSAHGEAISAHPFNPQHHPDTPRRRQITADVTDSAKQWREMPPTDKLAWKDYARTLSPKPQADQTTVMTGFNAFVQAQSSARHKKQTPPSLPPDTAPLAEIVLWYDDYKYPYITITFHTADIEATHVEIRIQYSKTYPMLQDFDSAILWGKFPITLPYLDIPQSADSWMIIWSRLTLPASNRFGQWGATYPITPRNM
jgi:hypothetical protein